LSGNWILASRTFKLINHFFSLDIVFPESGPVRNEYQSKEAPLTSQNDIALWYVSEAGIILSYPEANRRGRYLAFWIVARNLGQVVGGAINLSLKQVSCCQAKPVLLLTLFGIAA
jgi:hypothetical protein